MPSALSNYLLSVQRHHVEMRPESSSEVQHLSLDRISTLPSCMIESILCLLPIRDAVRTSILSKKWRYKWSTISKLVFKESQMFDEVDSDEPDELENPVNERNELIRKYKVFSAIQHVLLMHQGPIVEFTLDMKANNTCTEIDLIIRYLSRNKTVKKFALELNDPHNDFYRLPLSVFSLNQLTDLTLLVCELEFDPTSSGFSSLTSLSMTCVKTSMKTVLHLLSSCPLLKSLNMILFIEDLDGSGLQVDMIELFKCLPVIEHLSFDCLTIEWFYQVKPLRELPTKLVHLKYLCIWDTLSNEEDLLFLFLFVRCSPNLEKIKLRFTRWSDRKGLLCSSLDGYLDICLVHLKELEIECFRIPELEFLKLILAKSPVLEKVRIGLGPLTSIDEELKMLRIVTRFPRASPVAEIIIDHLE